SPDKLAISLEGRSVKLVGADELVTSEGTRRETTGSGASSIFTKAFTRNYEKIAKEIPIYTELRNLIDMSVVAAFLQDTDVYGKLDWNLVVFGNETRFRTQTFRAPQKVETAVNAIWRGATLITPIGGGVEIYPKRALKEENLLSANDENTQTQHKEIENRLPENGWWWN
ncbi:MAG: hypothetical protein Q4D38_14760, partial [Planctomycetia bacterium]|nr:hypothetical protein [Planctomycetia bacterium]